MKSRSKRLRKKLCIGEFQKYGFEIACKLSQPAGMMPYDIMDRWLAFVEEQDWSFGGGIDSSSLEGFLTKAGRGTLHEKDCLRAETWLNKQEWVESSQVGPLSDVMSYYRATWLQ